MANFKQPHVKIKKKGSKLDSFEVLECQLSNSTASINVLSFGCTLQQFKISVPKYLQRDVVLGYSSWKDYKEVFDRKHSVFFGAIVGPIAGRISNARIPWNNETFEFEANEAEHLLHGGKRNFSNANWQLISFESLPFPRVIFGINSKKSNIHLPGELYCEVTYTLFEKSLIIKIESTAIEDTLCNPTQHSYFNPGGHATSILDTHASVYASGVLDLNTDKTPTGSIKEISSAPFKLNSHYTNLDQAFVLSTDRQQASLVAQDGFQLRFSTNQPTLQVYVGGKNPKVGKENVVYNEFSGICLEQQAEPDAPNHDNFSDIYLQKGQKKTNILIIDFEQT